MDQMKDTVFIIDRFLKTGYKMQANSDLFAILPM